MGRKTDNRFRFTQRKIAQLPLPDTGYKPYYDEEVPKLTIRVYATGSRTYYASKRNNAGALKPHRIGDFKEVTVDAARMAATEAITLINKGIDPNEERERIRRQSQSLASLLDEYIEEHDLKESTADKYRSQFNWGFSDWMKQPASKITEENILARHKKLTAKGKTTTNGAFRALRAVLNYAVAIKAIDSNPVTALSAARLWHKNKRKSTNIIAKQLGAWLSAVDSLTPSMHRVAFRMMLFMGYRITETYSIKWDDVDLEHGRIVQRDTKNGTDHELPIPTLLQPMIEELRSETDSNEYMFPAKLREGFHGYPKRQIKQINDAVDFDFNPHMTRHTFITIAEALGISSGFIKQLVNHDTSSDVTDGYSHQEFETKREAINRIAAYIEGHAAAPSGKVVQLYG